MYVLKSLFTFITSHKILQQNRSPLFLFLIKVNSYKKIDTRRNLCRPTVKLMLRMNSMTTFWGFCIFIVVSVYCDDNGTTVYVQTFVGNVKGKVVEVGGRMYNVFLGIPYAQPPVKELRFKVISIIFG